LLSEKYTKNEAILFRIRKSCQWDQKYKLNSKGKQYYFSHPNHIFFSQKIRLNIFARDLRYIRYIFDGKQEKKYQENLFGSVH